MLLAWRLGALGVLALAGCSARPSETENIPPPADAPIEPPPECSPEHLDGTCGGGAHCSVVGTCIDGGACAADGDCAAGLVCHAQRCTLPSATYAGNGADAVGLNATCDIWKADPVVGFGGAAALESCELALTLAKNMGVSWVRWGVPWYWLTDGATPMSAQRKAFLTQLLGSARARGMKILFQLAIPAPVYAYVPARCDDAMPPVCSLDQMLTFDDAKFASWLDEVLELTRPYTHFYELWNEINYGGEGIYIPIDASPADDPRLRLLTRMKRLYEITRARMDAAALVHPDFSPELASSGLAYGPAFYNTDTFDGSGQLITVGALNYVSDLAIGTPSGGGKYIGDVVDIVSVHPYWLAPGDHAPKLAEFRTAVDAAAAVPGRSVWASEVGYARCEPYTSDCNWTWPSNDDGVDYIDGLMQAVTAGSIQKVFWFTTFVWAGLDAPDPNQYGMYSEDGWSVRRPGQVIALRRYARATPFD